MTPASLTSCLVVLLVATAASVPAAAAPPEKSATPSESHGSFRLLPKFLQSDPQLEMTVLTEMSEAGKKLPPVSPRAPAYYVTYSGGYHPVGDPQRIKPLGPDEAKRLLTRALAARGYAAAAAGHPPTLLVVYIWGSHTYPPGADSLFDGDPGAYSEREVLRNILSRAALVAGDTFAAELAQAVQDRRHMYEASAPPLKQSQYFRLGPMREAGAASENPYESLDLGAAAGLAQTNGVMDPVKLFVQRSAKTQFLVEQATDDCFYIIASAYAYASVAAGKKQLLWRTRMTVNARGVSETGALPALIVAGAPYFGREMSEPEVLLRRVGDGCVEIGTPTVVGAAAPAPPSDGERK